MRKIISLLLFAFIIQMANAQIKQLPNSKPGEKQLPVFKATQLPAKVTKVAFEADITREISSPRSPLHFDAVKYNDGNGFSSTDNIFIAPTAGLYFFSVNFLWNGFGCSYNAGASASVSLIKNGREGLQSVNDQATSSTVGGFSSVLNFSTKLNAGDKVNVLVVNTLCDAGGGSLPILRKGTFSGCLIAAD